MIKQYVGFCKKNFQSQLEFQHSVQKQYDREARKFQYEHNQRHPGKRIWRHVLYTRTYFFYVNGSQLSVDVTIVRFIYAGTNGTFTFYGSLFSAFTAYSLSFLHAAVSEMDDSLSAAALAVSAETLRSWSSLPAGGFTARKKCPEWPEHKPPL